MKIYDAKVTVRPLEGVYPLDHMPTEQELDEWAKQGVATTVDPDVCERVEHIMCMRPDCEHCRSQDEII